MSENFYDEVEFEDLEYDEKNRLYYHPCPCGDRFQIALDDMYEGWDVGVCPSCSLQIKVIFDDVSRTFEVVETKGAKADDD